MSLPVFTLECNFAQTNAYTPAGLGAGTNLAGDLTSFSVRRGRQTEQDQATTGTLTFVLNDDTRKYDKSNASGPFFGNLVPAKGMILHAILDSVGYWVFVGLGDAQNSWQRSEVEPGWAEVTTQANDGFDFLANGYVWTGSPGGTRGFTMISGLTGLRVVNIITSASYPWGHATDNGFETMQASAAVDNANTTALQLIRDAEATEPGFFWIDKLGQARFTDRRSRLTAVSQATFCDKANFSAGRILIDSLTTRQTVMVNDATVTADTFPAQEYSDAAALQQYLDRPASYSTKHTSSPAALSSAKWRVNQNKDPREVMESLTLVPGTDSATWAQILGRDIGDRITVIRTPQNTGVPVSVDCFIENVSIDFGPGPDATCTWRLANADTSHYWLAGVAGSSEAGTTTKAGY